MIEIIRTRDNKKVIAEMIEARSTSVWSHLKSEKTELNFTDAVYYDGFHHLIRVEKFIDTMLDVDDDFAQEVNEILYSLEKDNVENVIEILNKKYEGEINTEGYGCTSGYTYNNPDSNFLNRDIMYDIFEYDGERYAFIQVHYGADARIGFGAMVCFKVNDIDYFYSGMEITAYNTVTDEDISMYDLDDIATINAEGDWIETKTGNLISIYSSADGY